MSQEEEPPGPDGLPLVGSMPKYGLDPFEYRKEWAEGYGDLVHIDGGVARDGYLVTSRELFEQILVTDDEKCQFSCTTSIIICRMVLRCGDSCGETIRLN